MRYRSSYFGRAILVLLTLFFYSSTGFSSELPPSNIQFDISDLREQDSRYKWERHQENMRTAFRSAANFSQMATQEGKREAWKRFLETFSADNPYSNEDEKLRANALSRLGTTDETMPPPEVEGKNIVEESKSHYNDDSSAIPTFVPATLPTDENPLSRDLEFPESGESDLNIQVNCTAEIDRSGRVAGYYFCTVDNDSRMYRRFRDAVTRIVRYARFSPARTDLGRTSVEIVFSVHFVRKDGEENIYFLHNHLLNYKSYGIDYVAPQLRVHTVNNIPRCLSAALRLTVSPHGEVVDASVPAGKATKKCKALLMDYSTKWKFIPGFVENKPVEMDVQKTMNRIGGFQK